MGDNFLANEFCSAGLLEACLFALAGLNIPKANDHAKLKIFTVKYHMNSVAKFYPKNIEDKAPANLRRNFAQVLSGIRTS